MKACQGGSCGTKCSMAAALFCVYAAGGRHVFAKAWACVLGGRGRGEGTSISMGDFSCR